MSEVKELMKLVENKIYILSKGGKDFHKADLAKLRRGLGKIPGSVPEIWNITIEGIPAGFTSQSMEPSKAEWAVHLALTLYALHQQGNNFIMHKEGQTLGVAVRKLIKSEDDEQRIKRRFDATATSSDFFEITNHIRGLIQLLKSESIALDYSSLVNDLYFFQFENTRDSVKLQWGRDFYKIVKENNENDDSDQLKDRKDD